MTLKPPQPGGEVRQKEGLGLLPLLLGLALEEQGWGTPASGGEVQGYPCKWGRGAGVPLQATLQQLSEGLYSQYTTTGCQYLALPSATLLSCLLDSAPLKGCAEPWTGAEGTQTVPQLPSMANFGL